MIPNGDGKPESDKIDPEQLTRLLDIELAQKRAEWAQAGTRYQKIRNMSLLFLALVIIGALLAFFFLFVRFTQDRPHPGEPPAAASPSG